MANNPHKPKWRTPLPKRFNFIYFYGRCAASLFKIYSTQNNERRCNPRMLRIKECADCKSKVENTCKWIKTMGLCEPRISWGGTWRFANGFKFWRAEPTFRLGLRQILVGLCFIMIMNIFGFTDFVIIVSSDCQWHVFSEWQEYSNGQRHFLPRIGEHPDQTLRSVIMERDTRAKASNIGKDVVVPVDFAPDVVLKYRTLNEE